MPSRLARAARRHRRAITRRIRRAIRRRLRALAARRATRRQAAARARATASPLAPRSITGTPRPARGQADRHQQVGGPQQHGTGRLAAPMNQRVKRTKDGKFNGSTSGSKKSAAKKSAAKKSAAKKTTAANALTPQQRKAAQTVRILAAGNKRVARVDQRIDRMFRH